MFKLEIIFTDGVYEVDAQVFNNIKMYYTRDLNDLTSWVKSQLLEYSLTCAELANDKTGKQDKS